MRGKTFSSERGASLPELLGVIALMGVAVLIPALAFDRVSPPLDRAEATCAAALQQVRAAAMAETRAYRISPSGVGGADVAWANTCGASTWTDVPKLAIDLPDEVRFTNGTWAVCFDSRGLASTNATFTLSELQHGTTPKTRTFNVLLGGSATVAP